MKKRALAFGTGRTSFPRLVERRLAYQSPKRLLGRVASRPTSAFTYFGKFRVHRIIIISVHQSRAARLVESATAHWPAFDACSRCFSITGVSDFQ